MTVVAAVVVLMELTVVTAADVLTVLDNETVDLKKIEFVEVETPVFVNPVKVEMPKTSESTTEVDTMVCVMVTTPFVTVMEKVDVMTDGTVVTTVTDIQVDVGGGGCESMEPGGPSWA